MEKSVLQNLISMDGMQDNTWIRPYKLTYIMLSSAGNQFFNPVLQKLKFDSTHEVIEIKYSKLNACTSLLKQFSYNYDKKEIHVATAESVYYYKKIREPKIGDKIGVYDPNLNSYAYSAISKIDYAIGETIITMTDSTVVAKIKNTNYGLRFFIMLGDVSNGVNIGIPTEFYTEEDISKYSADIFIPYDLVLGFQFKKMWC